MKKLITILLFLSISISFAQVTKLWTKSVSDGNLPTWFSPSSNTERGFAYNPITDKLYIVSRNAGLFVKIVSANDGSDVGELNLTGVSGGTYLLNDIESGDDGVLYGCNLVIDLAGVFKIYKWVNDAATPVVVFESDFGIDKRMGDNFYVTGRNSNNSTEIWFAESKGNKVYTLGTTDNGNTFTVKRIITLPAATFGGAASVFPLYEDSMVVVNSSGKYLTAWKWDGTFAGQVPAGQVATGSTTTRVFGFGNIGFLFTFQYFQQTNSRLVDTQGEGPDMFRTYAITPDLGVNTNTNGTGDLDFKDTGSPEEGILFVLGTNNGFGAYKITRPNIVNGRFHEIYFDVAQKQNNNAGFGPNIDIKRVNYNVVDEHLYLAVESKVNKTNNDGILIFLGVSNLAGQGAAPGTPLGAVTNGGHAFGVTDNPNFKNGFETHFAFAINAGGNDSVIYVDAAKYTTSAKTGVYLGNCRQAGVAATGPASAGVFSPNSITFAFDTAYGKDRGFEIKIPLAELGNATSTSTFRVFAVVASATAYFSDVTVPGNVTSGNLGFNPDFNTLAGGPYFSSAYPLPVELVSFNANPLGSDVTLNWTTASELNNAGFEIERSQNGLDFTQIGFVTGKGNSAELNSYSYTDLALKNGKYFYRLKQVDYDGSFEYSKIIQTEIVFSPAQFELTQNYPNPFNPTTTIKFSVPADDNANLTVFNALGQEVAILFNGEVKAGTQYEVTFDAKSLSSGVYFYRLKSSANTSVKKMIINK